MKFIDVVNGQRIEPDENEALRIEFLYMKNIPISDIASDVGVKESQLISYLHKSGLFKRRLDIEDCAYIQSKQKKTKVFKPSPYVAEGKQYWDYTELFINTGDYL